MSRFIGNVSAYAYAVEKGYTGTEEEFAELMASYATVGQTAVEAAQTATTKASEASQSATTATNKASEATTAAQTAINKSAEAQSNAQTASTKASEATTAATAAQTAKTQTEAAASQALTDIGTASSGAISAVQTEGVTQTANARAQALAAATSATTASTKASEASASATSAGQSATNAAASATSAAQSASDAQDILDSIPADYSDLSNDVGQLKADLGNKNVLKTSEKTSVVSAINSFLQAGKNLYDPYRKTEGYFININTGDLAESTGQNTSDYISVTPNTAYTISWKAAVNQCRYAFYDSNKTFIANSGGKTASSVTSVTLTSPATAAFLRFSIPTYTQDRQVEKGDTATTYEPYTLTFDDAFVWSDRVAEQVDDAIDAHNFSIRPEDTTFFHVSKNMIDPSTCVLGEIVNQTNGAFSSASAHNRTTYIEINPSTTYVIRPNSGAFGATFRYAFYTSNKVYISGAVGSLPDMLLTSPANAKYMVISATYAPSNMMIALYVDENKSFEAFDNVYVKPQFIVAGDADGIVLNLPEKVYALVGYELNIYFDNITENSSLYKWDVTCTKGIQLERGYRITPVAADVGTYTLTIRASISENIYKEVSTTLVVTAATVGSGDTATVIILGDSTTNNGIVIEKLNANFASDVMSISTLGTRGTSPNLHEGRSGWKLSDYFTTEYIDYTDGRGHVENPFYNPTTKTFDASYYFANSGVSVPDFFVVNMGINDVFGSTNDAALSTVIEQVVGYVDSIITSLKAVSQTLKICICCTIPPNHSQDAFGKAYGCTQTRDRCKRNNLLLVERLIEEYDGRESEGIYLIPIHTNLDTVYNMGLETLPVNARNTDVTYQSPISNGGVHPVASGYWQIADVYTAFLKANA